jgi:hypothetical protein
MGGLIRARMCQPEERVPQCAGRSLVMQVPAQHEERHHNVKRVQDPDRTGWKTEDIDGMNGIPAIGQHEAARAVGTHVPGTYGLEDHWNGAAYEHEG